MKLVAKKLLLLLTKSIVYNYLMIYVTRVNFHNITYGKCDIYIYIYIYFIYTVDRDIFVSNKVA